MKALSIIVPVYNKGKYLEECVQSILNQTIKDFELILVNDGSIDDSAKKCDGFSKIDARVTVIHQENQGVSAARNAGLNIASGDYIGFVDADDILEPRMYELLIHNIEKYNADISICGVKRVSTDKVDIYGGKNQVKIYDHDTGITGLFNGEILMSNYDKLYRRSVVNNIFFQPALFEDTYYNFEALVASAKTVYDDTVMYNYMIRDNSHSLASFNQKYMNALKLSKRMVDVCTSDLPDHVDEAKAFDFNTNMININMIITDSVKKHKHQYNLICSNLKNYNTFYLAAKLVTKRYKLGYSVYRFSPSLYSYVLGVYSRLTNSDHLRRKQNLPTSSTLTKPIISQ